MNIQSMELFLVPPRWLFLKITTSDGLVGWGEPVVEGRAATVKTAVEELGDYLIGKDAGAIEDIWQALYRGGFYRGGPILTSAISGIDQALWDIKGKRLGVPVYDLLGGPVRNRMRVYAWIGGDRPAELAESARERIAAGYTALKMNATAELEWIDTRSKIQEAADRIGALRDAIGYAIEVGIDFHGRVHKTMAKVLAKELEQFKPMFYEEPVLPENNEGLIEIARHTSIPIATGERMFTRWDYKSLLADGVVDIIQPDLSHAGGIWEVRKIAAMAEAYDIAVAPHCPLGPLALGACLQIAACTPNHAIQEISLGIHYNTGGHDLLNFCTNKEALTPIDGYLPVPEGPGLGIDIDEAAVREADKDRHRWRNPIFRTSDGGFAEW